MCKLILFSCFLLLASFSQSQTIYPFDEIKLNTVDDFKAAEPIALYAANFLLSNPFNAKDNNRIKAMAFLIKWMIGTKEYHFSIGGAMGEVAADKDAFGILTAAVCKFSMENKTLSNNPKIVENNAIKLLLDYCNNPNNNLKLKSKMRKKLESN